MKIAPAILIGTMTLGIVIISAGKITYDKYAKINANPINLPSTIGSCSDAPTIAVVESLRREPNEWETDNYKLARGEEVSVWIANEEYGISISLGSEASADAYNTMPAECKNLLYRETQTWYKEKLNERLH